jgi:hypothetical protein
LSWKRSAAQADRFYFSAFHLNQNAGLVPACVSYSLVPAKLWDYCNTILRTRGNTIGIGCKIFLQRVGIHFAAQAICAFLVARTRDVGSLSQRNDNGRLYIFYGSYFGGISARQLSDDGLHSDPATQVQITIANRYEGPQVVYRDGYWYLFVSATDCCRGPLTDYLDGVNWVRGGTWTHELGSDASIRLVSMGGAGFTANFDYVRVYRLK